ncbi:hypothetical protein [Sanguibacter suaedae]|uniref:Uncharacterized protein n=1 Tax=Sanguibacter suaedae TaxID=2795737 RepID=A0A934I7E8_9MICO|nr:hypothetical protein [Sanguibacter suaedae]MBI9115591.1 hypothetical protein [Sanguibacter suaedae]
MRRDTITVIVAALVAFATNVVLDVATDLPMLGRWGIAVAVALVVVTVGRKMWERDGK